MCTGVGAGVSRLWVCTGRVVSVQGPAAPAQGGDGLWRWVCARSTVCVWTRQREGRPKPPVAPVNDGGWV